jgi:hypothetical protein
VPKNRPIGDAAAASASRVTPDSRKRARALIANALKLVPMDVVLDELADQARAGHRAAELLATLALRGDQDKLFIEDRSGPSIGTEEAGARLGVTAETVRTRIARNLLVGYAAATDRTKIRLPSWQFTGEGVHAWVAPLLAAFGANGWALLDFVTVPRRLGEAEGPAESNHLHRLLGGHADEVIAAAARSNPD